MRGAQMTGRENEMSALLFKESGLQSTVDLGMTVLQGRVLGGTTLINNCICFRLDEPGIVRGDTLARWEALGAPVDPAALARSYDAVERTLGVARIPERLDHGNGRLLLDGWRALAARGVVDPTLPADWFRKNFDDCGAAGVCNWGCPHDRKASALETYVTQAVEAGARVMTESHARRIEIDDGRATGVRLRHGDRDVRVRSRAVVVACGAIGSSVLLQRSGVRRNVGTRLSFNAATVMLGALPGAHRRLRRRPDDGVRRHRDLPARELVPAAGRPRHQPARAGSRRTSTACATTRTTRAAASSSARTTTGASSTRRSCATCSARSSTG